MKKMLLLLLIGAFLIAGCSEQKTIGKTFIGGTEGLTVKFLQGTPPDTIIDGGKSTFSIITMIENKGEDTVDGNEGYIELLGLDPGTYGVSTLTKKFDQEVTGAVRNSDGSVREGGVLTVSFEELAYKNTLQGDTPLNMYANMCYKYTTRVTAQICVKKDAEQLASDDKICAVEGEKNPQNSGGPIQVTSLKQQFAGPGKTSLIIQIKHAGKGDSFFKPEGDIMGKCTETYSNTDKGVVHVKFNSVNIGGTGRNVKCSNMIGGTGSEGYIRLLEGQGDWSATLYCTLEANADSVFEVPIDMEVSYFYLQHIEKPITIRHVG